MAVRTVVVDEDNRVVYPVGFALVQEFTSATRAATVPAAEEQLGYETDTGLLYKATGTDAGDWQATAGGLRLAMSGDSYVEVFDGGTSKGRIQLIV